MPDRKVIDDSEDEDAASSPSNSPSTDRVAAPDGAIASGADARLEQLPADSTIDQRSTDSEFFQQIYEGQQRFPKSPRDSRVDDLSSDKQKSSEPSAKNSSSITDPSLKHSRRPKAVIGARDLTNLTQVTTPRHPGSDVYDFPVSDGEDDDAGSKTKSRTTKTYGKRKRGQSAASAVIPPSSSPVHSSASNQLSLTHIHDDDDTWPKSVRKRRRNGTQKTLGALDEDVDLLVVPRTAETVQYPRPQGGSGCQDAAIPDTLNEHQDTANHMPASFFIAPPNRLTVSQKQEYLRMSGSSDPDEHASHGKPSHLPHPETQAQKLRSSEATIAYTTPSRYCSSAPGFPELPEDSGCHGSGSTTSNGRKARDRIVDRTGPHSSPDELSSHALGHLGPQKRQGKNPNQGDNLGQDDWDSDNIGCSREQYKPRPSRRRSGNDQSEEPTQADAGVATEKHQKTCGPHDVVHHDVWDSDKIGAHRENYRPRPSRRRSRAMLGAGDEELVTPEQSMPDTCPPGPTTTEAAEDTEPVLVSSRHPAPQNQNGGIEGIDPTYLAALPEDLRQEVIADQLARKSQASRTRGRGRPSQGGESLVNLSQATPQRAKRGRKKKERPEEDPPTVVEEAVPDCAAATTPAAGKKKRGRPKKSGLPQPPLPLAADDHGPFVQEANDTLGTANGADTVEGIPPREMEDGPVSSKAPSKRGRNKVAQETSTVREEGTSVAGKDDREAMREAKASSKRGRKKSVVEEISSADDLDEHSDGSQRVLEIASDAEDHSKAIPKTKRKALTEISNTASSPDPAREDDGKQGTTSESLVKVQKVSTPGVKAEEHTRSASSATNQQGKVPLRVGLSKRSRIAPLLKIIRK